MWLNLHCWHQFTNVKLDSEIIALKWACGDFSHENSSLWRSSLWQPLISTWKNSKLSSHGLELAVWSLSFLWEVSSCPPSPRQTVNWQASSIWQDVTQQQSSSLALTAPAKGSSCLHCLLWVSHAHHSGNCFSWNLSACSWGFLSLWLDRGRYFHG